MQEKNYELMPRDILFFRDGRPMDADKALKEDVCIVGHGASWPRPDHLYNGVMHSLLKEHGGGDFGVFPSLKTVGPYPVKNKELFLPRPLDWDMEIGELNGTDYPAPLKYGFIDRKEGKKKHPDWISARDYNRYLESQDLGDFPADYSGRNLYMTEVRIGTTMDPVTGASKRVEDRHASGQYQVEYLRLAKDVSMWCAVDTGNTSPRHGKVEAPETPCSFVMGGQGGIVTRCETDIDQIPAACVRCRIA